ncbi:SIS domain-containing protein [Sinorhizobium medicae]|nr:SIS domain-containing protein [Sinorhizobium medicae]
MAGEQTAAYIEPRHTTNDLIRRYLTSVVQALTAAPIEQIADAVDVCNRIRLSGGTLYICGNGGSAASAAHAACDLVKLAYVEQERRLRAVALTENMAMISAYGNDLGYASIFQQQIAGLVTSADALIGISVSGSSENVLLAMEYARSAGAATIGLSGMGTPRMRAVSDIYIRLPGTSMQSAEDAHMAILHALSIGLRGRQSTNPVGAHNELKQSIC